MAIIYTYPTKATPIAGDLILISDSADANKTKQVTVGSLPFTNNPGTVTSVGLSMPSAFEVGNSPVTSSGTINVATVGGNAGQFLSYDGTWRTPAGGAANPAGALTQIQYHDTGGVFGASANLSFSTDRLTLTDTLEIKGDGVNPGTLKLYCENIGTPHAVSILGPIHLGATPYSIRLPKEIATQTAYSSNGRILESDASGALQWIATPTGGGSGPGTGTQYNLPIWSTTSTLGDSLITQNAGATVLNVGTNIASFSTTAGVGSVFATRVSVNGYSTFGGKLKLNSPDGATFVEIEGPANGGAAYTLKLPSSAPGDNQILQYTTSGNLGWINTPTDTTYNIMGSGNSYAAGLVLAGSATHNDEFLRKDGTWQTAGGAVTSYTNANNNYILTSSGAGSINGESSLLYNGSTLTLGTSKVFNASRSTVTAGVATAPIYVTNSTLSSGAPTNFASNIAGGNGSRHIEFYHQGTSVGSITSTTGGIQINGETSDQRKKKNIVDWTENVLDKFALIEPKKFNFTHQDDSDPLIKGFIAQQMVDKFPEAYNHDYSISDTEGYYSFNAMGMNIYLMKAIKELKEEIDSLKSRVSTLEG